MEDKKNSTRKSAILVGILILVATVASVVGYYLIETVTNGPDYLGSLYPKRTVLKVAVFFNLISNSAVVGIAVLMFVMVKKYNENIAGLFLGTRLLEAGILAIGNISLLLLSTISREYIKAGNPAASYFHTLGTLSTSWSYWSFEIAMIACGVGSTFLCYFLYTSKFIPRWLSVFGIIGYGTLFLRSVMAILGYPQGFILFIPVGLFELVFPIWLIAKGFNAPASAMDSERYAPT